MNPKLKEEILNGNHGSGVKFILRYGKDIFKLDESGKLIKIESDQNKFTDNNLTEIKTEYIPPAKIVDLEHDIIQLFSLSISLNGYSLVIGNTSNLITESSYSKYFSRSNRCRQYLTYYRVFRCKLLSTNNSLLPKSPL